MNCSSCWKILDNSCSWNVFTLFVTQEAETMHLKAIAIKEQLLGVEDYEVGLSIGHLASLYNYHMKKYKKAEQLYLRSIAISEYCSYVSRQEIALQVLFSLYGVMLLYLKEVLYFAYVIGCKLCESTWWSQSLALKPVVNEIGQLTNSNWTITWILIKVKYWHGTGGAGAYTRHHFLGMWVVKLQHKEGDLPW